MADPPERKAHVKRIFAMTGDLINTEVWIDVLRIDKVPIMFQSQADSGEVGQLINYIVLWNDDPNNPIDGMDDSKADVQGENANGDRTTHQLEVRNPQSPADTPVKLYLVDKLRFAFQPDEKEGVMGRVRAFMFNNTPPDGDSTNLPVVEPPSDRKVTVIRVVNNDLGGMQMADPDGSNPRIADWKTYLKAMQDGVSSPGVHLDVEVTEKFKYQFQADEDSGAVGQIIWFVLSANQDVEGLFDQGDKDAVDINGEPSVLRTDPLQTIVNVGWGGLAVIFGPNERDAPPWKPSQQMTRTINELLANAGSASPERNQDDHLVLVPGPDA